MACRAPIDQRDVTVRREEFVRVAVEDAVRQGRREPVRRIDRPGRRRAQVRFVDHRRVDRSPWPSIEPVRDGCSPEHRMHTRQRPADQVDVRCGRAQGASLGVSEEGHDSIATNRHPDRSAGPLSSLFEPGGDAETRLLFGRADLEHEALRSGRDEPGRRVHRDQGLERRSVAKPLPYRFVREPLIHVRIVAYRTAVLGSMAPVCGRSAFDTPECGSDTSKDPPKR